MPKIELCTEIRSTLEICFDLSRSIDLHQISTAHTNEKAIAGTITGLINLGESVTWQATHFGIKQQLTSKITAFKRPYFFCDEQQKGIFQSFCHRHVFEKVGDGVLMKDTFEFHSPYGIVGRIFNKLMLTAYMKNLLVARNQVIKEYAESDKWKLVLLESGY